MKKSKEDNDNERIYNQNAINNEKVEEGYAEFKERQIKI